MIQIHSTCGGGSTSRLMMVNNLLGLQAHRGTIVAGGPASMTIVAVAAANVWTIGNAAVGDAPSNAGRTGGRCLR
jgi:hypothetical protein